MCEALVELRRVRANDTGREYGAGVSPAPVNPSVRSVVVLSLIHI